MKNTTTGNSGIIVVPHKDRPASLEAQITGIPQWKKDVFNLVAQLTQYRLKNKMTQEQLAEKLHVSQPVIARFEKLGRYPTIEFLYKVAEGLGLKIDISTHASNVVKEQCAASDSKNIEFESCKTGTYSTHVPIIEKKESLEYWFTGKEATIRNTKISGEKIIAPNRTAELFNCADTIIRVVAAEKDSVLHIPAKNFAA